jgi:hypothetical protein
MNGADFKKIRLKLNLRAAALGRALGYEGSDANIARTVYRLEAGRRPIPRPIGRLLEMFDAFGVPPRLCRRRRPVPTLRPPLSRSRRGVPVSPAAEQR